MTNFLYFLKKLVPFLLTIAVWYLALPFWNPAGIVALIPIFYYSFVKPIKLFPIFSIILCFLIDYKYNIPFVWTCVFCLFYSVNGFQNYIDLTNMENNAINFFLVFIGIGILFLTIISFSWITMLTSLVLFVWLGILYILFTLLNNKLVLKK